MITLYHRTCEHRLPEIQASGELLPQVHPTLGYRFVWLTNTPSATREQLALSSHTLQCDRMTHLLRVTEGAGLIAWNDVRRHLPSDAVRRLEASRGSRPSMWWVGTQPLKFEVVQ